MSSSSTTSNFINLPAELRTRILKSFEAQFCSSDREAKEDCESWFARGWLAVHLPDDEGFIDIDTQYALVCKNTFIKIAASLQSIGHPVPLSAGANLAQEWYGRGFYAQLRECNVMVQLPVGEVAPGLVDRAALPPVPVHHLPPRIRVPEGLAQIQRMLGLSAGHTVSHAEDEDTPLPEATTRATDRNIGTSQQPSLGLATDADTSGLHRHVSVYGPPIVFPQLKCTPGERERKSLFDKYRKQILEKYGRQGPPFISKLSDIDAAVEAGNAPEGAEEELATYRVWKAGITWGVRR